MARVAVAVQHMTPEQFADRLQVSVQLLAEWRHSGKGPAYIRGESSGDKATVRYPLDEVLAWEKSRLVTPGAA